MSKEDSKKESSAAAPSISLFVEEEATIRKEVFVKETSSQKDLNTKKLLKREQYPWYTRPRKCKDDGDSDLNTVGKEKEQLSKEDPMVLFKKRRMQQSNGNNTGTSTRTVDNKDKYKDKYK